MRRHLSYANVAATLALVFAMGGGAYAAVTSIPGSDGIIHGCYSKSSGVLRLVGSKKRCSKRETAIAFSQRGRDGASGPAGVAGLPGTPGQQGAPGPVTGLLARGVTLRGTYSVRDQAGAPSADLSVPISWGFSLALAPATHLIPAGSPAPSGCAGGTGSAPAADPGNLCIFETGGTNVSSVVVFDPVTAAFNTSEPYGTGLIVTATAAGEFGSFGSWAVTGS